MKWLALLAAFILLFPFLAAESGQFNFATMQQGKAILVEPGKSAIGKIYVFNVYGNRPTHVLAGISEQLPAGFTVELLPPVHNATYNISGVMKVSEENFVVEPSPGETLPKLKPETAPEGVEYITVGTIDGFVPAKVILINVTADKSLPLWKEYNLTVAALAHWYDVGSTGPVGVKQARGFSFTVRTVSTQYSEEAVASLQPPQIGEQNIWFYATTGLALLVVALLAFVFLRSSRKR